MNGEPDTTIQAKPDGSRIGSLSIRAVITLALVGCVCTICTWGAISSRDFEVHEPLYSLVMLSVGFFFGQKTPTKV